MAHLIALGLVAPALAVWCVASAQSPELPGKLDYSRSITQAQLESKSHTTLPEQYIWTRGRSEPTAPVYFRSHFSIADPPGHATLYIAGGQQISAWINGQHVGDYHLEKESRINPALYVVDIQRFLKPGDNVLAISVLCFDKTLHEDQADPSLLVKIVPAEISVQVPSLLISGMHWKASINAAPNWQGADFSDAQWSDAELLGGAESSIDFFQVNNDSSLYRWPGYDGISPFLAHRSIDPLRIQQEGGSFRPFSKHKGVALTLTKVGSHSVLVDFGRELNGRLEISSASSQAFNITYQYGESAEEAIKSPYLGVEALVVPPHARVYGSKSAFRYVKLSIPPSQRDARIADLQVDGIYYPVQYQGSFESSDAKLNRIWEVGAYTVHLCMQDGIWDAPKRDRSRWMGDVDVSGNVINHVFADHFLMQDTMNRLNPPGLTGHVNHIPGYSAFWIMGEADYYRAFASRDYLNSILPNLLRLLSYMEDDLDSRDLFANRHSSSVFVDWSFDFDGKDTPEAYRATHFEYYKAFRDGAWLLKEAGESASAAHYELLAARIQKAAEKYLKDSGGAFGPRVQSNVMAIYSGLTTPDEDRIIASRILRPLEEGHSPDTDLSPYYGNYVIYAMAKAGQIAGALHYIRYYWGSMLDEGATSFWEGYDPRWEKNDFHSHLRADDSTGYETSLAHGWSSGPTAWLMDEILGLTPISPGYAVASIRPELVDLQYARGTLPTPAGLLRVEFHQDTTTFRAIVNLPEHVTARVSLPATAGQHLRVDGRQTAAKLVENASRLEVEIGSGEHRLIVQ